MHTYRHANCYTYEYWYMAEVWILHLYSIQVLAVQRMAETL